MHFYFQRTGGENSFSVVLPESSNWIRLKKMLSNSK